MIPGERSAPVFTTGPTTRCKLAMHLATDDNHCMVSTVPFRIQGEYLAWGAEALARRLCEGWAGHCEYWAWAESGEIEHGALRIERPKNISRML